MTVQVVWNKNPRSKHSWLTHTCSPKAFVFVFIRLELIIAGGRTQGRGKTRREQCPGGQGTRGASRQGRDSYHQKVAHTKLHYSACIPGHHWLYERFRLHGFLPLYLLQCHEWWTEETSVSCQEIKFIRKCLRTVARDCTATCSSA